MTQSMKHVGAFNESISNSSQLKLPSTSPDMQTQKVKDEALLEAKNQQKKLLNLIESPVSNTHGGIQINTKLNPSQAIKLKNKSLGDTEAYIIIPTKLSSSESAERPKKSVADWKHELSYDIPRHRNIN